MKLHGEKIVAGDKVYDLLEGYGFVMRTGGVILVSFGNNVYEYSAEGKRLGTTPNRFKPLLYWRSPIVMIPPKDDSKWEKMIKMFRDTYKIWKD